MLQDIRANSQGIIAKTIIGLIVVSFAIFGIESLLFSGGGAGVAVVNGEEISPFDLQQELSVQQRQLLAMLGDDADPALLDQELVSQQALEVLIQREIIRQAAGDMGLTTSDQAISDIIADMTQFQIDGRFSADMFRSSLASAGFTPALFSQRLADDIQIGQLRAGLAASDFATPAELEFTAGIFLEGRDVRYISVPLIDFELSAELEESDIQTYFDDNADAFMSEETLDVEFLLLTSDRYLEPVDEDRLREEFELVRDEYEVPTERRVSHILIEGDDADAAARLKAAQDALTRGDEFAAVAAEFSDDIGSSQYGGELGYTAGDTFPEAMEEAIGAMSVGEVSAPVDTDAGTHLILLTDIREGSEVQFEDVAMELQMQIQEADAGAALLRDVEDLRDLVFNAADLAEPARALELTVQTANGVSRNTSDGVLGRPDVLQALFSDDVLAAGHNSEVLELDENQYIVVRVAARNEAQPLALEDVRDQITAELRRRVAREEAVGAANELLQQLEAGTSVEDAANAAGFTWQVELGADRTTDRLPASVRTELFSMAAPQGQPRRSVVDDDPDTVYVVEFSRLADGSVATLSAPEQQALRDQLAGESGGITQQQYERALREQAEVVVY